MIDFTPRNVAKGVVITIIGSRVTTTTERTIANNTRFDEDDLIVEIPSYVISSYVTHKVKPYTDKMVDKTADWLVARRAKKNQDITESE